MMDGVRWTLSETESGSPREARQGGRISVTHAHTCTRMHTQLPVPGRCRKSALGSKVCAQGHVGLRAESVKTRVHILLQMALPYGTPQLWSGRSRGGDRQSRGDPGCLGLSQPASSPVPSRPVEHQHLWVSTQPLSPRSASDSRGRPSRRKATGWQGACSKDSGGNASMDEARSHHPLLQGGRVLVAKTEEEMPRKALEGVTWEIPQWMRPGPTTPCFWCPAASASPTRWGAPRGWGRLPGAVRYPRRTRPRGH